MTSMQAESRSDTQDVRREIEGIKKQIEVEAATNAGAQATQAATHAGTWSTMLAGAGGLVVGMFLALALKATSGKR
jgi:hypothetical protein